MFRAGDIDPPKQGEDFEELCLAIFREIWRDPLATRHGRSGQRQHGVDILSSAPPWRGVECKKRKSHKHFILEIDGFVLKADQISLEIEQLTIACTLSKDVAIESKVRQISEERIREGKFPVTLLCWDDILSYVHRYKAIERQFFPSYYSTQLLTESALQQTRSMLPLDHVTELLDAKKEGRVSKTLQRAWRHSAVSLLERMNVSPLERASVPGSRPVSMTTEYKNNWILALAREDGSITVRRLRMEKHVWGVPATSGGYLSEDYEPWSLKTDLSGEDVVLSSAGKESGRSIEFDGEGSRTFQTLRIRDSAHQLIDIGLRVQVLNDISTNENFLRCLRDGLRLRIGDTWIKLKYILDSKVDELIDVSELDLSSTPLEPAKRVVAWLTRGGSFGLWWLDGPRKSKDTPVQEPKWQREILRGGALRIRRFWDYRDAYLFFIATQQIAWVDARRPDRLHKISSPPDKSITDALVLLPFVRELREFAVAYDDGTIEFYKFDGLNVPTVDEMVIFDRRIVRISAPLERHLLIAVDAGGIVAVIDNKRISYICDEDAPVIDALAIDSGRKVITLNSRGVLSLWDIEASLLARAIDLDTIRHRFRLIDLCQREAYFWIEGSHLVIEEPRRLGGFQLFRLRTGKDGPLELGDVEPRRGSSRDDRRWRLASIDYALAAGAPVAFRPVERLMDSNGETLKEPKLAIVRYKLAADYSVKIDIADIESDEIIAMSAAPDGKEAAVLDVSGGLTRVSFLPDGTSVFRRRQVLLVRRWIDRDDTGKFFMGYSPNEKFLIYVDYVDQQLHSYNRETEVWSSRHKFGDNDRHWPAPGFAFGRQAAAAWLALRSGHIVEMSLGSKIPIPTMMYEQPPSRIERFASSRVWIELVDVVADDAWIVGYGDRRLLIWPRGQATPTQDIQLKVSIRSLVASPSSDQFLTVGHDQTVNLWRCSTGEIELTLTKGAEHTPVFAKDGSMFLVARRSRADDMVPLLAQTDTEPAAVFEKLIWIQSLLSRPAVQSKASAFGV